MRYALALLLLTVTVRANLVLPPLLPTMLTYKLRLLSQDALHYPVGLLVLHKALIVIHQVNKTRGDHCRVNVILRRQFL